jgi:hypothetical protein
MLSIGIFALILTAIYSTWIAILRGTRAGQKAAAEVQRARVALRALEDAFNSAQFYAANHRYYYFYAKAEGDFADVNLVARLPDGFLGSEQYQQLQQKIRRVHFEVVPGKDGAHDLMMTQQPILLPDKPENSSYVPYTITLAKDVTHFQLAYFDPVKNEWLDKWEKTNQLPKIVQFALGLGHSAKDKSKPSELVYSLVTLTADPIQGNWQGGPMGLPPGAVPPGALPPGIPPPVGSGGIVPGQRPGGFPK